MPSQFVWKSYGRFTSWSQRLWLPPITFSTNRKTFHHFSEQFQFKIQKLCSVRKASTNLRSLLPWCISSLMVVCTGLLTFLILVTNMLSPNEKSRNTLNILQLVFIIMYIALAVLTLVLMHLSVIFGKEAVEVLNQLIKLDWTMNKCELHMYIYMLFRVKKLSL